MSASIVDVLPALAAYLEHQAGGAADRAELLRRLLGPLVERSLQERALDAAEAALSAA